MSDNFENILIVAAHPDDDILGCGGIISKFSKSGTEIKVIFIAEGTSCRYNKCNSKRRRAQRN